MTTFAPHHSLHYTGRLGYVVAALGFVWATSSACGPEDAATEVAEESIINGGPASPATRRVQGALYRIVGGGAPQLSCGAVYIGADHQHSWALTAAHCVSNAPAGSRYAVVFGGPDLSQVASADLIAVDAVRAHPGWTGDAELGGDIALLRLSRRPPAAVTPAPLATAKPTTGAVVVSGYGADRHDIVVGACPAGFVELVAVEGVAYCERYTDVPLQARLDVIANSACSEAAAHNNESMLCVGGSATRAVCHGDSGGPAHVNGVVVGITSYGDGLCGFGDYAAFNTIYTSVAHYRVWIDETQRALAEQALVAELNGASCAATALATPAARTAARAWAAARNFQCTLRCATGGGQALSGSAGCDIIALPRVSTLGWTVEAGGGDDLVFGSDAADTLRGGAGADELRGFGGDDKLYGGAGADVLDGGSGNNVLVGD